MPQPKRPTVNFDQLVQLLTKYEHGPFVGIQPEDENFFKLIKAQLAERGIHITLCPYNLPHKHKSRHTTKHTTKTGDIHLDLTKTGDIHLDFKPFPIELIPPRPPRQLIVALGT